MFRQLYASINSIFKISSIANKLETVPQSVGCTKLDKLLGLLYYVSVPNKPTVGFVCSQGISSLVSSLVSSCKSLNNKSSVVDISMNIPAVKSAQAAPLKMEVSIPDMVKG